MKSYNVTIPCTMAVVVTVQAENPEKAKLAAFDVDFRVEIKSNNEDAAPEILDFETHEQITRGNYYYGCINDMSVEEVD